MSPYEARCKSCGRVMYFLRQEGKGDKSPTMPVDAMPASDGNLSIDLEAGTYRVVGKGNGDYVSHFLTCPRSREHRKERRR